MNRKYSIFTHLSPQEILRSRPEILRNVYTSVESNSDILLFSNIISSKKENARTNGYVWVSFDGGKSWPLKKSVDKGSFAYSSMVAGRLGTISEGMIFLFYESESGAKLARFNLQWLLDGVDISTYLKL